MSRAAPKSLSGHGRRSRGHKGREGSGRGRGRGRSANGRSGRRVVAHPWWVPEGEGGGKGGSGRIRDTVSTAAGSQSPVARGGGGGDDVWGETAHSYVWPWDTRDTGDTNGGWTGGNEGRRWTAKGGEGRGTTGSSEQTGSPKRTLIEKAGGVAVGRVEQEARQVEGGEPRIVPIVCKRHHRQRDANVAYAGGGGGGGDKPAPRRDGEKKKKKEQTETRTKPEAPGTQRDEGGRRWVSAPAARPHLRPGRNGSIRRKRGTQDTIGQGGLGPSPLFFPTPAAPPRSTPPPIPPAPPPRGVRPTRRVVGCP